MSEPVSLSGTGTPALSEIPRCGRCASSAKWSVQNLEGLNMEPVTRWFACGRHINVILATGQWECDTVQIMRLDEGYRP